MEFWEDDRRGEVLFFSHNIKSTYCQCDVTIDVNLDHLAEVGIVKFLPFHTVFFGNKSLQSCPVNEWEVLLHLLWEIIWIYVSSPPYINLFNHLFISTWTHKCLFHNLGYNTILLYSFCCSDIFRFDHWKLFQLVSLLSQQGVVVRTYYTLALCSVLVWGLGGCHICLGKEWSWVQQRSGGPRVLNTQ